MPQWFFPAYELIFGRLDIWLASLVILACARNAMDDLFATVLSAAAAFYVSVGALLGLVYLVFQRIA